MTRNHFTWRPDVFVLPQQKYSFIYFTMATLTFIGLPSETIDMESRGWGGGLAWLVVCWAG